MRVLVVGGGSAGRRHARNLRALGVRELALVEPGTPPTEIEFSEVFPDFASAPLDRFDLVVVASPTRYHAQQALSAARAGCHVFVEKPLAIAAAEGAALLGLPSQRVLTTACNMRFHPSIRYIESLLRERSLGAPIGYSFHAASWLPHWKPSSDYRASYSARRDLGGGALLDCIHEIDLATWFFGPPDSVSAFTASGALPGCDVEDRAVASMRHGSLVGQLFLSFSTFGYHRRQLIACERGSIFWDIAGGRVTVVDEDGTSTRGHQLSPVFDFNQVYLAELRHLLAACAGDEGAVNRPEEALRTVAVVDAFKRASELGVAQPVVLPALADDGETSLRPFAHGDLAKTLDWMRDPAIFGPFLRREPVTPEGHARWFEQLRNDATQCLFAVEHRGNHVGNAGLKNIDLVNRKAELWLYIGDRALQGRGIATAATRRLVAHAFGPLDLRRIWLQVADENRAALRVYAKAGFHHEGILCDDMLIDGRPIKLHRMAVLRRETAP